MTTNIENQDEKVFKNESSNSSNGYNPEKKPNAERINYGQDWKAYNTAKTLEPILFKTLLFELLDRYFSNSIKQGKRILPKDRIFMMCMKIYNNSALRKAKGQLKDANIADVSFKSICNFFNDPTLTEAIDDLLLISAIPVSSIEKVGAIDSTGFSGSKLENWNATKFHYSGTDRADWFKAHVVSCCKSNIVISVSVTDRYRSDPVMLESTLQDKTKYFQLEDFVADKAYSSKKILEFVNGLGLNPIIPFKKNVTGNVRGSILWAKMFKYFHENQEEFYKRYHQRSNAETTFFMVKQKFGANLFNKNQIACINEIKVKFLCHNICVLIQEMFESNIIVDFQDCVNRIEPV